MHDGSLWSTADFDGSALEREAKRTAAGFDTCAGRSAWLRERGSNFLAIESSLSAPMVEQGVCSELFATLIVFREPLARLHSHLGSMLLYHFPLLRESLYNSWDRTVHPAVGGRRFNVTALAPSCIARR